MTTKKEVQKAFNNDGEVEPESHHPFSSIIAKRNYKEKIEPEIRILFDNDEIVGAKNYDAVLEMVKEGLDYLD